MNERTDVLHARSMEADRRGQLAIEVGQVVCPRRGPLDIEQCWTCRDFGGQTADGETLVCGWSRLWTLRSRWTTTRGAESRS
jgi:hypothetical protein